MQYSQQNYSIFVSPQIYFMSVRSLNFDKIECLGVKTEYLKNVFFILL